MRLYYIFGIPILLYIFNLTALPSYSKEPWEFFALHAFDHLDNLDKQAEPAYQCGVSVIYACGVGVQGYIGIPPEDEWEKAKNDAQQYAQYAKSLGIPVVLGYLCSTSIVGLKNFDKNFPAELKNRLSTPPSEWLQQDIDGKPLPSWYGGEYNPACMNNPDWQIYQKYMVKTQLELGLDGIFFDNPTVHPQGCYCPHCMQKFANFLQSNGEKINDASLPTLRNLAKTRSAEFKKFRCTIARDFFSEMRTYAKQINPKALITANNSLNSPEVIYSQCHSYGYNIKEMSKSQDFVVIEDMYSTPRRTSKGATIECSPTYDLVNSIIGKKTLVAVTIADGNYHTPPNMTNLAIFEAFTRNTNYMLWPTWKESQRQRMIQTIGSFVKWLKQHSPEIESATRKYDVLLYFPFEEWINSQNCKELSIARELTKANIQYAITSEENFHEFFPKASIVIASNPNFIPPTYTHPIVELCANENKVFIDGSNQLFFTKLKKHLNNPILKLTADETVRAIVKETQNKVFIMLYNLNIERLSSYEEKITPAKDIDLYIKIPAPTIEKVIFSTPDKEMEVSNYEITHAHNVQPYLKIHIAELTLTGIIKIMLHSSKPSVDKT